MLQNKKLAVQNIQAYQTWLLSHLLYSTASY